jgi:acetaldehyde dehydrogenase (acetylating)
MPVFRIVVNTQTSMGATGYTTGLAPAMSLGCGAWAGNITSDNITPLHLINVKRVARARARADRGAGAIPAPLGSPAAPPAGAPEIVDFVCEDDVRRALRAGRSLKVKRGGIVTPAARDLASGTGALIFEG